MPISDFNDLCTSLCNLVGVEPPRLEPDALGNVAFTITLDEVDIGFVRDGSSVELGAVMIVNFGALDEANELQVLRRVLDANFMVSGIGSPVFVRNPISGEIVLHRVCIFSRMSVQDVYRNMVKMLETLGQWKAGEFFEKTEVSGFDGHSVNTPSVGFQAVS